MSKMTFHFNSNYKSISKLDRILYLHQKDRRGTPVRFPKFQFYPRKAHKLQHFRQNNENGVCTQVWKEQLGQQWQNSDGQPHHMVAKSLDGTLARFMGLLIPRSRNAQLLSLTIFYLDSRNILTTLTWLCHSFFLQLQPLDSTFDPNFL